MIPRNKESSSKLAGSSTQNRNPWTVLDKDGNEKLPFQLDGLVYEFTLKIILVHNAGGTFNGKSLCAGKLEGMAKDLRIPVSLIPVLHENRVHGRCSTWDNLNYGALKVIYELPHQIDSKLSFIVTESPVRTFEDFWKEKALDFKNSVKVSWWEFIKHDFDVIFRGLRRNVLSCFLDCLSSASEEIFISVDLRVSFLPKANLQKSGASYLEYRRDIEFFFTLLVSVLLYPQNQRMIEPENCFDYSLDEVVSDYNLLSWINFVKTNRISTYVVDETSACIFLMSSYFLTNVDKAHFILVVNEHLKLKWLKSDMIYELLDPVCKSSDFSGEDRIQFYKDQKDHSSRRSKLIKNWDQSTPQWKMALYYFGPDELFRVLQKPTLKNISTGTSTKFVSGADQQSNVVCSMGDGGNRTSKPVHIAEKTVEVQVYEMESDIVRYCVNALHHTNEHSRQKSVESHEIVDGLQRTFPRLFVNMHLMLLTRVSKSISDGVVLFDWIIDKRKFAAQLVGHESPTFSGLVCSCVFCHIRGKI